MRLVLKQSFFWFTMIVFTSVAFTEINATLNAKSKATVLYSDYVLNGAIHAAQDMDAQAMDFLWTLITENPKRANIVLLKRASENDPVACLMVAENYFSGRGFEKNDVQALLWMQRAAELGNHQAQNRLTIFYIIAVGTKRDLIKASQWAKKSAEQGDMVGQANLASFYAKGVGLPRDEALSFTWNKKAAMQGHIAAQYEVALNYYSGRGVEKDRYQSFEWMKKAAVQGHAGAQEQLALFYRMGIGVEKNQGESFQWMLKSAQQGYAKAQYGMGYFYLKGIVKAKDVVRARTWLKKASRQGHHDSKKELKRLDDVAAAKYLQAAKQGDADAQYRLGKMHERGLGVEIGNYDVDKEQVFFWYKKAAEQGHVAAQFALGKQYLNAVGAERDVGKAIEWYKKSAHQGNPDAQIALGREYKYGFNGVAKDLEKSIFWYRTAAQAGDYLGQDYLAEMLIQRGIKKDMEEAVLWYEKAADQGLIRASQALAWLYAFGQKVEVNETLAIFWFHHMLKQYKQNNESELNSRVVGMGMGVGTNQVLSAQLYLQGIQKKDAGAFFELAGTYTKGLVPEYNHAFVWYQKAAQWGHAAAQYQVALAYEQGKGVKKDKKKAILWYEKSANQGFSRAADHLTRTIHESP